MASNAELLKISKTLKDIFDRTVWGQLKGSKAITDRTPYDILSYGKINNKKFNFHCNTMLIDSVIDSLTKSKTSIETEIIVLKTIKQQIIELKEGKKK